MIAPHVYIRPESDPDILARNLIRLGALARSMPPAWDGAGISHLVASPDGDFSGRMLPGRGFLLACDPRDLGITKDLPAVVYAQTAVRNLIEALGGDERAAIRVFERVRRVGGAAITTYDGIIAARAGGKAQDIVISKASATMTTSAWGSLLRATGFPAAYPYVAIPGGEAPDRSATGAWSTGLSNPTGGDKKYLLTLGFTSAQQIDILLLADLLSAAGSILATTLAAQTVNSTALTRYTSGAGVLMTFEVTTTLSNTAHNITVNKYTNQSGTTLQTTGAQAGTAAAAANRLVPVGLGPFIQLASGDYGVQSVQEVTFSAALAAGAVALNLYFPLAFIPGVASNAYVERDSTTQIDGISELVTTGGGALGCLMAFVLAGTTSTGIMTAFLRTAAG